MFKIFYIFLFILCTQNLKCEVYDDRPKIKSSSGDLILVPAYGRNLYLRANGPNSKVFVADIDVTKLNVSSTSQSYLPHISNPNYYLDQLDFRNGISRRLDQLENNLKSSPIEISANVSSIWNKLNRLQTQIMNIRNQVRNNYLRNKCHARPCENRGTCLNLPVQYYCLCPSNWEGRNCDIDVDECRNFAGTELGCQNGATCVNKPGSYECICRTGWYGLHCTRKAKDCSGGDSEMCGHGVCIPISTGEGIKCICDQGWTTNGTGPACTTDINECESFHGPHCSINPKVDCINLPGSFRCGQCPIGYEGDGYVCSDIDECTTKPNGGCSTSPMVPCYNTIGSRICGPCPPGYQGDGVTCSWRGSCSINHGGCHPSAQCIENGSGLNAMCICPMGTKGDGVGLSGCYVSTDANSTLHCENNPCGPHGRCHPLPRAYTCFCDKGYGGAHCESTLNYCTNNPCRNGGTCRQDDTIERGYRCECPAQYSGELCQLPARICGGVLDAPEGNIIYPLTNTSTTYNHNSRCAWVIHTNPNKVINVTFTRFDIEFIQDCAYDFLQIHDGRSSASQLIGRFCGTDFPRGGNIISSHNNLYFWFRSDQTVAKNGFALHWNSIDPVCGGRVNTVTHGSINSPGWPGKYPPNRDCYWYLSTTLGKKIQLYFFQLDLEAHVNCSFDYLALYDGEHTTDPLINKYCKKSQPAPVQSAGSEILIHFHSDAFGSGNGFQISYATIEGVPSCGGLFTSDTGEITSPSYNGKYMNNLLCDYQIKSSPGTKILINIQSFELERTFHCSGDYLKIYDGSSSDGKLVGKFCDTTFPSTYLSSSNTLTMQFKSDHSGTLGGFKIAYQSVCHQTIAGDSGTLMSPGYPNNYPANKICEYIIMTSPGKAIQLIFQDFDIEDNNYVDCKYDNVEIRDGPDINSTLLGRYCGGFSHLPPTQISTHNYMYLRLKSDLSISGTGFLANFTTIDTKCGGIYTESTGLINHPSGSTLTYDNDETCIWMLVAKPGYHIKLTWNKFDIENMSSCLSDYLELTEIDDNNDQNVLGRYCGSVAPPALTTSTSKLKLHFLSDSSSRSAGFSLSYTFLDAKTHCGGLYVKPTGYIYSPGWPKPYEPNRDCVWIIIAPSGQQIQLNISQFDLETAIRNKCNYGDYLEIINGPNQNSPSLGRFCGNEVPRLITSMSNSIYIHFHSDFYLGGNGFKIEWDATVRGCGGTLTGHTGTITSPNYPQTYGENAECFYRIITSAGNRIKISFTELDLEISTNCRDDYVEVYDGRDTTAKTLGRYCSMSINSNNIETSSNFAMIKFRSDVLIGGKGFNLNYYTVCTQNLTGSYGVIESPNYPNSYPDALNCLWTITVPKGNKINITFTNFNVRKGYYAWPRRLYSRFDTRRRNLSCNDYVQVRDDITEPFNNKICGTTIPNKITTKSNIFEIKFITDSKYFHYNNGFRLEWVREGCGGSFFKDFGFITFPTNKLTSNEELECEWKIEATPGTIVRLTISNMYVKIVPNCTTDALELYDGPSQQFPLLTKICSRGVSTYQSNSNLMFLRFVKKSDYRDVSFTAVFETSHVKCGGRLSALFGTITSPNYPRNYDNNMNCMWYLYVPANHLIEFNILDLDLYSSGDMNQQDLCNDSIRIYSNDISFTNYTHRICASSSNTQIISKSNVLTVEFITDDFGTAKGFKANYSITCGARIQAETSGILTNDEVTYYHSNRSCVWTIIAPKLEQKISLTLTHMSLPKNNNIVTNKQCSSSYIRILDGNDETAPLINEFCGRKVPPMIVSRGNALTIVMGSYVGMVEGKFSAHYSVVDSTCGGTLTSEEGSLASPNYPFSYPGSADCEWILSTSPGNKVYLTFETFNLESSENCNSDYLEIRENNGGGRLLGLYCGSEVPTNTTVASKIYVKFHSDNKASSQGFLAHYGFIHGNEFDNIDTGDIASPLYPHEYQGSGVFSWRITTSMATNIIITITRLEIVSRNTYCYNSLTIYDGYDNSSPILKELCGLLGSNSEIITTTSNAVFLEFKVDESNTGSLFYLQWSTQNTAIHEDKINCGSNGTVFLNAGSSIDIKSPAYGTGSKYLSNSNCEWLYRTSEGAHFEIKFVQIELEQFSSCNADYISIFSSVTGGGDWKPIREKICSTTDVENIRVNDTNFLKIVFVTDSSVEYGGFHGIITAQCGGLIRKLSGVVSFSWSCWNESQTALTTQEYEWKVKVRPGRTISLHIDDFNVTNTNEYCISYLVLRNGESKESPNLGNGKYCGYSYEDRNTPLTTSSNAFYVKYIPSHIYQYFKIRYEELDVECGVTSKLDSDHYWESINSPNYPSVPSPYSECVWIFTGPPGEILRVDFLERFDFTYDSDCAKEFIEIRDGATEISPLIGKYCQEKPSSVKTTNNIIFIKYSTQLSEPRNGFKANVSINVCGGTIFAPSGEITSPGYPRMQSFPIGTVCEWKIVGYSGNIFNIKPLDINLPESENHCGTSITIEEHLPVNKTTNVLKTFCAFDTSESTASIESFTNEIIFKLVIGRLSEMTQISDYKGFRFKYTSSYPTCGETVVAPEGFITTPGYPRETSMRYCRWHITVSNTKRRVKLEILDATVGTRFGIYNDHDFQSPLKSISDSYMSSENIFESSGNKMAIDVWVGPSSNYHRFKAKFSSDDSSLCGGLLDSDTTELIFSNLNRSFICEWHLINKKTTDTMPNIYKTLYLHVIVNTSSTERVCGYFNPRLSISSYLIHHEMFLRELCSNTEVSYRLPGESNIEFKAIKGLTSFLSFQINWRKQPCGGVVEVGEQPIDILKLHADHSGSLDCAWVIQTSSYSRIELQLEASFSYGCSEEFLNIHEDLSQYTGVIGRYCKQNMPSNPIIVHFRQLYIEYHTNDYKNDTKIELIAKTATNPCGGLLTYEYSMLTSPNYPKSYSENQECIWEISTDLGSRITLEFIERFVLEEKPNCTSDAVIIYDWKDDEYLEIGKICGRLLPHEFNSTHNKMKVIFRSNDKINLDGFKAQWKRFCGGNYIATEKEQFIYSPGYPEEYSALQHCKYVITSTNDNKIILNFLDFNLEGDYPLCSNDNVTITLQDSFNYEQVTYCGKKYPPPSNNFNNIEILFRSDIYLQKKGFKLSYQIFSCDRIITEPTVLNIANNQSSYDNNLNCTWSIIAPKNKTITLRFLNIDIEENSECSADYIAAYEGAFIIPEKRIALICGHINTVTTIKSVGNNMLLQFVSDFAVSYGGFNAEVSFTYSNLAGCGEVINMPSESYKIIKSPFIGNKYNYDPLLDCNWMVTAPTDRVIQIEFTSFHVSPCRNANQTALGYSNCHCDYVEMRDGFNPNSIVIGKFCGHSIPPKLITSGNSLSIKFYTDGEVESSGFEATLSVVESLCGKQHFVAGETVQKIKSPGYNNIIPRGIHCSYFITNNDSYKLMNIKIVYLDLLAGSDNNVCDKDRLIISSGGILDNQTFGSNFTLPLHRDTFLQHGYLGYFSIAIQHPKIYTYCGKQSSIDLYSNENVKLNLQTSPETSDTQHKGVEIEITEVGFCGRNYTGHQGRIQFTSTGTGSEKYDCYTLISAPENFTISLYIFNIGVSYWSQEPFIDFLDGKKNDSPILYTISHSTSDEQTAVFSTSRYMLIHNHGAKNDYIFFDSNFVTTDKGMGCGGKLQNIFGVVISPMYPNVYRKVATCEWEIETPRGTSLLLHFKFFDLGILCDQNYIQLVDRNGKEFSKYCAETPADYRSPDNYVKIIYKTTLNNGGKGWVAEFAASL